MGVAQAMNQPRAEFELTSEASGPCRIDGWPVVQMLDSTGASLPTKLIQASSVYVPGTQETPTDVLLAPGAHAFFGIGWVNSAAPGPCEHPASFRITPPNGTGALDVAVKLSDGSLPEVCDGGTLSVLPVQPIPPAINFNLAT